MAVNPSLSPFAPAGFGVTQARHLLARTAFGASPRQVASIHELGLKAAVDFIVDFHTTDDSHISTPTFDANIIQPRSAEDRMATAMARRENDKDKLDRLRADYLQRQAEDLVQMRRIERWWLSRMIESPRPLEEKLTLLWHSHFATNHRTIHDSWLMYQQNQFFRKNAPGNFADLAMGIIRDPAMIRFLNNDSNRKSRPNENLARELMELFTLGEGNYTEADIKEGARALTGFSVEDNDFVFNQRVHDGAAKTILGQRGTHTGEDFVRILLTRPQCPLFVARKIYRHFVGDIGVDPEPAQQAVITSLARLLVGNRYELRPVLKSLFMSQHFYDPAIIGAMVKSPVQLLVGTIRSLETPPRDNETLCDALAMMDQKLFDPPSVAGWDGGRGWINTSTLFVRQNVALFLIAGKLPYADDWTRDDARYDPMFLLEGVPSPTPAAAVDRVVSIMVGEGVPAGRREPLLAFMKSQGNTVTRESMLGLVLLVAAMPEYQLC